MSSEGLRVRELLKNTYDLLAERNEHEEHKFSSSVLSEIANDSDWHRTRIGYMRYEDAKIYNFNKEWLISRGEKAGSYPADPYDSDIIGLCIDDKIDIESFDEEISKRIRRGQYFKNTLLGGMADGRIFGSGGTEQGKKVAETIIPKLEDFVYQKPEYDQQYISLSTLGPVNTKKMLYKQEFPEFIVETIETVLKE